MSEANLETLRRFLVIVGSGKRCFRERILGVKLRRKRWRSSMKNFQTWAITNAYLLISRIVWFTCEIIDVWSNVICCSRVCIPIRIKGIVWSCYHCCHWRLWLIVIELIVLTNRCQQSNAIWPVFLHTWYCDRLLLFEFEFQLCLPLLLMFLLPEFRPDWGYLSLFPWKLLSRYKWTAK